MIYTTSKLPPLRAVQDGIPSLLAKPLLAHRKQRSLSRLYNDLLN